MSVPAFVPPGTFPRPRLMGRMVRILVGLALLYFWVQALRALPFVLQNNIPRGVLFWTGGGLALYALPGFVDPAYGRPWGRSIQRSVLAVMVLAAAGDLLASGSLPGPWLARVMDVLLLYVTGHAGLAFLLAGLLAVPG